MKKILLILIILLLMPIVYSETVDGNVKYNPDNIKQAQEDWDVKNVKLYESETEIEIERAYSEGTTAIGKILAGEVRWDTKEKTLIVQPKGEKKAQLLLVSSNGRVDVEAEKALIKITENEKGDKTFQINLEKPTVSLNVGKVDYVIKCEEEKECKISSNMDVGESYYLKEEEKIPNSYEVLINVEGEGEISKKDSEDKLEIVNIRDLKIIDEEGDFTIDAVPYSQESRIGEVGINSCLKICSSIRYSQDNSIQITGSNFKVYDAPDNTLFMPNDVISSIIFADNDEDIFRIDGDCDINYFSSGCKDLGLSCVSISDDKAEIITRNTGNRLKILYYPKKTRELKIHKIKNDEEVIIVQNNAYGQMTFSKSQVQIVSSNIPWYEFDTSFTAEPYLPNKKDYGLLICDVKTKKCTLDGKEIQGPTQLGAKSCKDDKDCDSGKCHFDEKIDSGFCVQDNKCTELKGTPQGGPVNVVIIAPYDKYKNPTGDVSKIEDKAKKAVRKMFTIDPYSKFKGKFSFSFLRTETGNMDIFKSTTPAVDYLLEKRNELCPSAEIVVGMIDGIGTSFARESENVVLFYKKADLKEKEEWDPFTFTHEMSHIFGLADEYTKSTKEAIHLEYRIGPNCIAPFGKKSVEERAKEVWSQLLGQKEGNEIAQKAIANKYYGCGGCTNECLKFLRPSENSIMKRHWEEGGKVFNKPSIQHIKDVLGGII